LCSAALLGHDLTDIQLAQIQRSKCRSITLWPDADLVGRRGFIKIADKLSEHWHGDVHMMWPVPGPADDVPLRAIRLALTTVVPYTARIRHRMLLEK
jgi:DNA primase